MARCGPPERLVEVVSFIFFLSIIGMENGAVRMRLVERIEPNPAQLAARLETEKRDAAERSMIKYFEGLKKRYPVRIMDPALKDVALPAPRPGEQASR